MKTGICEVCQLVDGNIEHKTIYYCNVCGVYICKKCEPNFLKRAKAFIIKKSK